jgi:hypothetical protein
MTLITRGTIDISRKYIFLCAVAAFIETEKNLCVFAVKGE